MILRSKRRTTGASVSNACAPTGPAVHCRLGKVFHVHEVVDKYAFAYVCFRESSNLIQSTTGHGDEKRVLEDSCGKFFTDSGTFLLSSSQILVLNDIIRECKVGSSWGDTSISQIPLVNIQKQAR